MSQQAFLGWGAGLLIVLVSGLASAESSANPRAQSGREVPPPSRAMPGEVTAAPDEEPTAPSVDSEAEHVSAAAAEADSAAILTIEDVLLASRIASDVQRAAYWMAGIASQKNQEGILTADDSTNPVETNVANADSENVTDEDVLAMPIEDPPATLLRLQPRDTEPDLDQAAAEELPSAPSNNDLPNAAPVALEDTDVLDSSTAPVNGAVNDLSEAEGSEMDTVRLEEPAAPVNEEPEFTAESDDEEATAKLETEPADTPFSSPRPRFMRDRPALPERSNERDTSPAEGLTGEGDEEAEEQLGQAAEADVPENPAAALIEVDPPQSTSTDVGDAGTENLPIPAADPDTVPANPNTSLDALGTGKTSETRWGSPNQSEDVIPTAEVSAEAQPVEHPEDLLSPGTPPSYSGWLVLAPAATGSFPGHAGTAAAPEEMVLPADLPVDAPVTPIAKSVLVLQRGSSKRKQVALTFDDGPHPEATSQILGILDYYDIRATFFFTGVQAQKYPQWVQMTYQAGHEIGNHTYDHFRLPSLPRDEQEYQIDEYERLIEGLVGETPRFLRPPGGQINNQVEKLITQRGMIVAMWDVAINDTQDGKTKVELLSTSLKRIRNGSVILAHDGIQATIDMLPELIESLQSKGYEFVTMAELASNLK